MFICKFQSFRQTQNIKGCCQSIRFHSTLINDTNWSYFIRYWKTTPRIKSMWNNFLIYFFVIPNQGFANVFFAITSSISTSGISTYSSNFDVSLFFILLTIVGGSLISTSSGLKYIRFYMSFHKAFKGKKSNSLLELNPSLLNRVNRGVYRTINLNFFFSEDIVPQKNHKKCIWFHRKESCMNLQ